jgi:hypothetical protein
VAKGIDPDSGEHEVLQRDEFDSFDQPLTLSPNLLAAAARILAQDASHRDDDTLSSAARVLLDSLVVAVRIRKGLRGPADQVEVSTKRELFAETNILAAAQAIAEAHETILALAVPSRDAGDDEDVSVEDLTDLLARFAESVNNSGALPDDRELDEADLLRLHHNLRVFLRESLVVDAHDDR